MSTTKFNLGVSSGGGRKKAPPKRQIISLGQLLSLLDSKPMPDAVRKKVAKELSSFPDGAYDYAWSVVDQLIASAATQHVKEQGEPPVSTDSEWRD